MARDAQGYLQDYLDGDHTGRVWWVRIEDGSPWNVPGLTGTSPNTCHWYPLGSSHGLQCKVIYYGYDPSWCAINFYPYGRAWSYIEWSYATRPVSPTTSHVLVTDFPVWLNGQDCYT